MAAQPAAGPAVPSFPVSWVAGAIAVLAAAVVAYLVAFTGPAASTQAPSTTALNIGGIEAPQMAVSFARSFTSELRALAALEEASGDVRSWSELAADIAAAGDIPADHTVTVISPTGHTSPLDANSDAGSRTFHVQSPRGDQACIVFADVDARSGISVTVDTVTGIHSCR